MQSKKIEHNSVSKLFFSPGSRQQNETNDGVWNNKLKLMMIMLIVLRHIANIYKEGELQKKVRVQKMHMFIQTKDKDNTKTIFITWMLLFPLDIALNPKTVYCLENGPIVF